MLVVEDVVKTFQCGSTWERLTAQLDVRAIDGLSLRDSLERPLFIHGAEGSGKSVLLNLLAGFYPPDSGSVTVNDRDPWADPDLRRRVSVVRPGPNDFDPALSSLRNLRIIAGLYDLDPETAEERVNEALDFVGIEGAEQTVPVGELSNGTQSLISLASSLIVLPDVLLLDEPERFMGPEAVDRQIELLRGLDRQGLGIILATSRSATYNDLDGRRIFLEEGQIRADQKPQ